MRTSKPVSTISYNTEAFLKAKLDELLRNKKICDYMFIQHAAEEDERKDHIHLWIKPNTLLDTMDLQQHFTEIDPKNPLKPLKCIDFRASVTDEWILYSEHFEPYLATKGESRHYHYTKDDFVFADEDTFEDLYYHAHKGSEFAKRFAILQQLSDGHYNPAELVLNGTVPLNMATQLQAFTYMKTHYGKTTRGNHSNHEEEEEDEV